MRTAGFFLLVGLAAAVGCGGKTATTSTGSPDGASAEDDQDAVQGTWKVTKVDFPEGMSVPSQVDVDKATFVVEGNHVKVSQEGKPARYLTFEAYQGGTPKRVTFTPTGEKLTPTQAAAAAKGKQILQAYTGIYKLDGGTLVIAVPSHAGGKLPTAFKPTPAAAKSEEAGSPDEMTAVGVLYLTRVPNAAAAKSGTSATGSAGTKK
jgi:uncharacterized protein (TIGR03067 family)